MKSMKEYEYVFERYIANADNVKNIISRYGVAIIPDVLTDHECDDMNKGMWDTLEHLTQKWEKPIKRDIPSSWREMRKLYPLHSMLIHHWSIGHAQYIWNIRQNPVIVDIFAKIWKCNSDELLVSFDGVSYHMPPETTNLGWYRGNNLLHCDQSYRDSSFQCIQSWVTGYDVNEGDATLCILESSNRFHEKFHQHFGISKKENWHKLSEEEQKYYTDNGCSLKRIKCPKGSLVLWDSRTIHCGVEAIKSRKSPNFRNIVYVCYEPRENSDDKNLAKKIKAFEERRMTSHWPANIKLFSKKPRTYGGEIYEVEKLPDPVLSELGKKLVGY